MKPPFCERICRSSQGPPARAGITTPPLPPARLRTERRARNAFFYLPKGKEGCGEWQINQNNKKIRSFREDVPQQTPPPARSARAPPNGRPHGRRAHAREGVGAVRAAGYALARSEPALAAAGSRPDRNRGRSAPLAHPGVGFVPV